MGKTTRINTVSVTSKNPLRDKYLDIFLKQRKVFRAQYLTKFQLSERAFYHRLSGRDRLVTEEIAWIKAWKFKK